MKKFYQGNWEEDRKQSLGKEGEEWLIGNFEKFDDDIRKTDLLELKYWEIRKGEEGKHKTKVQKSVGEITLILDGEAEGFVGEEKVILEKGKYFYIPPGIVNNLVVKIVDSEKITGLTIKAPSAPGDDIKIPRC